MYVFKQKPQKFFNQSIKKMLAQGTSSTDKYGDCTYRSVTTRGKKVSCGVGILLPDSAYSEDIEYCPLGGLSYYGIHFKYKDTREVANTIQRNIHDPLAGLSGVAFRSGLMRRAREKAVVYTLRTDYTEKEYKKYVSSA